MASLTRKEAIIIVGTGDYYRNILSLSLLKLQKEGRVQILATVSRSEKGKIKGIPHLLRAPGTPLHHVLAELKKYQPLVLLGHSNELHTSDASDLVYAGFRVLVEKPYCTSAAQLRAMRTLIRRYPNRVVLVEYYLMMKTLPLLLLGGKIRKNSFYTKKVGVLKYYPSFKLNARAHVLNDLIGVPRQIYVDLLEGEGAIGTLKHRGIALTDIKKGGGMIQDLGIHALVPLFALEDYIGTIDPTFRKAIVRSARCLQYLREMKKKFNLPETRIAETYAELEFKTSIGIPVFAALGKYLPKNANQRRIIIIGSEGRLYLDLSSCTLYLSQRENPETAMLTCPKKSATKYYPVLRAALEMLAGNTPFTFDSTKVILNTQQFILNAVAKSQTHAAHGGYFTYRQGAAPHAIFK